MMINSFWREKDVTKKKKKTLPLFSKQQQQQTQTNTNLIYFKMFYDKCNL